MGFVADNLENVQKRTHLNGVLEKEIIQKLLKINLYFYPLPVNNFFIRHFSENLIR